MHKMKNILLLSIGLVILAPKAYGCDVCGCKLGGYSMGILPQFDNHFIGLRYSHASFNAYIDNRLTEDEFSNDTYRRIDLIGRYSLSSKVQLSFMLPFISNDMDGNVQSVESQGIGDPMVLINYNLWNNADNPGSLWNHSLLVGGGIKLPFGDDDKLDNDELINRNFQLGTGSVDYVFSLNYAVRRQNIGLNLESAYQINGTNDVDYTFGNQFNASLYTFYWWQRPNFVLLPYLGGYFEKAQKHYDGDIEQVNTGGKALFATTGLQLMVGRFMLDARYQAPLYQQFNAEEIVSIESDDRYTVGVNFSIGKRKKSNRKNIDKLYN